jgi:hypothetical protein
MWGRAGRCRGNSLEARLLFWRYLVLISDSIPAILTEGKVIWNRWWPPPSKLLPTHHLLSPSPIQRFKTTSSETVLWNDLQFDNWRLRGILPPRPPSVFVAQGLYLHVSLLHNRPAVISHIYRKKGGSKGLSKLSMWLDRRQFYRVAAHTLFDRFGVTVS